MPQERSCDAALFRQMHKPAVVEITGLTSAKSTDDALANKAIGLDATPNGYTWCHAENGTTMQLLPSDLHNAVRHTGGRANIKQAEGGQ